MSAAIVASTQKQQKNREWLTATPYELLSKPSTGEWPRYIDLGEDASQRAKEAFALTASDTFLYLHVALPILVCTFRICFHGLIPSLRFCSFAMGSFLSHPTKVQCFHGVISSLRLQLIRKQVFSFSANVKSSRPRSTSSVWRLCKFHKQENLPGRAMVHTSPNHVHQGSQTKSKMPAMHCTRLHTTNRRKVNKVTWLCYNV